MGVHRYSLSSKNGEHDNEESNYFHPTVHRGVGNAWYVRLVVLAIPGHYAIPVVSGSRHCKGGGKMSDKIVWYGEYETEWLKAICKGVRSGDEYNILTAANLFAQILPDNALIVAMPSHNGKSTYMYDVAEKIPKYRKDILCLSKNALLCKPHKSLCEIKKCDGDFPDLEMISGNDFHGVPKVCIIDNVYDTGTTANAALKAIPNARVFVLAKTLHPYKKGK